MNRRFVFALLLVAIGCTRRTEHGDARGPLRTEVAPQAVRQTDMDPSMRGISGVARAAGGGFWLVPERDRRLWRTDRGRHSARPIVGAPPDVDLESVAVVRPGAGDRPPLLAFGTESNADRDADQVLFAEVFAERATIGDRWPAWSMAYAPWKMTPRRNRGLEALCIAGDYLLALSDNAFEADGHRFAPVALRSIAAVRAGTPDASTWTRRSLKLTSDKGMISAVACRTSPEGLTALAVERYFGIMRVLRFTVDPTVNPADPRQQPITATVAADIGAAYPSGAPPNFEGLAITDPARAAIGGGFVLFSDNDYGGVTGPTVSLTVAATSSAARAAE